MHQIVKKKNIFFSKQSAFMKSKYAYCNCLQGEEPTSRPRANNG